MRRMTIPHGTANRPSARDQRTSLAIRTGHVSSSGDVRQARGRALPAASPPLEQLGEPRSGRKP